VIVKAPSVRGASAWHGGASTRPVGVDKAGRGYSHFAFARTGAVSRSDSGHHFFVTLDPTWLTTTFRDAGLTSEQAERAGVTALRRLLRRHRNATAARPDARFRSALTADPLVSVNRILGLGDGGLPFYDDHARRLSEHDLMAVLGEIGLESEVALAFAKVVVEAVEPELWFEPVWRALGRTGPVMLDELRRLDWSALRSEADRGLPPLDPGPPPPPGRRGPKRTEDVDLDAVRRTTPLKPRAPKRKPRPST
jgi:hypothetical protein